jgi:hypothetical protein
MLEKIKQFFRYTFRRQWIKTGNTDVIFGDLDFRGLKRIEVEEWEHLETGKKEWRLTKAKK